MSFGKSFLCFLIICSSFRSGAQIHKWEVFELALTAKRQYSNPYAAIPADAKEGLVQAVFTGTGGEANGKRIVLSGFWDGGQVWKVRFAPPFTGTWTYTTLSKDAGLSNVKGKLEVIDWLRERWSKIRRVMDLYRLKIREKGQAIIFNTPMAPRFFGLAILGGIGPTGKSTFPRSRI
jgi:hypothetical protein